MNKKGYAIHEMIILCFVLAIAFGLSITKVTFAYKQAADEEQLMKEQENSLAMATKVYVQFHEDQFDKSKETFLFGKDLIEEGYLIETPDISFSDEKVKVTYDSNKKDYVIEVVD